jgi:uncharacterized tellurite resistance protein B-like protein
MFFFFFFVTGRRPITQTVGHGNFYCPRCRSKQPYMHKTARQHVHLYYIPIAPAGEQHEFIECQQCQGTFRKEVLYYRPDHEQDTFEAVFEKGIRKVLVHMMMADHEFDDAEIATIQEAYNRLTGAQLSETKIHLEAMKTIGPGGLRRSLRRLAPMLNDKGRCAVLDAAWLVARADGTVAQKESELLKRIASLLGMTGPDYRRYMARKNANSR